MILKDTEADNNWTEDEEINKGPPNGSARKKVGDES